MKTAISIDDNLLTEADRIAHKMGLSRSRLFSIALEAYLRDQRRQEMLDQLNLVYAGKPDPGDAAIMKKMKTKFRSTIKEAW